MAGRICGGGTVDQLFYKNRAIRRCKHNPCGKFAMACIASPFFFCPLFLSRVQERSEQAKNPPVQPGRQAGPRPFTSHGRARYLLFPLVVLGSWWNLEVYHVVAVSFLVESSKSPGA